MRLNWLFFQKRAAGTQAVYRHMQAKYSYTLKEIHLNKQANKRNPHSLLDLAPGL